MTSNSAQLFNTSKLTNKQLRAHFRIVNAHAPVEELSPEKFAAKYFSRRRTGKTAHDHANGNQHRSAQRRAARAAWVGDTRGKHYNSVEAVPTFPN